MKTIRFRITGERLLMQSEALADPLNEITKEIKKITGKQRKTDEDHRKIGELEFRGGLYFDETLGPVIPAQNIERMLRDAAALARQGKMVQRGVYVSPEYVPVEYDGPRDLESLCADRRFHDRRSVVIKKARCIRERPRFSDWSCVFDVTFDEKVLDDAQIVDIVNKAGEYIGLGTFRPRFGRFVAEQLA